MRSRGSQIADNGMLPVLWRLCGGGDAAADKRASGAREKDMPRLGNGPLTSDCPVINCGSQYLTDGSVICVRSAQFSPCDGDVARTLGRAKSSNPLSPA